MVFVSISEVYCRFIDFVFQAMTNSNRIVYVFVLNCRFFSGFSLLTKINYILYFYVLSAVCRALKNIFAEKILMSGDTFYESFLSCLLSSNEV